jgi:hypothetical protein
VQAAAERTATATGSPLRGGREATLVDDDDRVEHLAARSAAVMRDFERRLKRLEETVGERDCTCNKITVLHEQASAPRTAEQRHTEAVELGA